MACSNASYKFIFTNTSSLQRRGQIERIFIGGYEAQIAQILEQKTCRDFIEHSLTQSQHKYNKYTFNTKLITVASSSCITQNKMLLNEA
jgi:hypothetical protein